MKRPEFVKGCRFYVTVLACIRFGWARTDAALMKRFQCNRRTVNDLTKRLAAAGLIYPDAWELSGKHWVPVWKIGDRPHAPHPRGQSLQQLPPRHEVVAFVKFWNELQTPTTTSQLVEASGIERITVGRIINHARALRMVRIAGWLDHPGQGYRAPMFALGGGADAPKPARRPMNELQSEYHARVVAKKQTNLLYAAITGRAPELPRAAA